MSFKLTIPGVSLKVFGRAIQSLSKIGDELYFEPREDGLFLRSVNSCRSAYACFQFSPNFFLHYVDVSAPDDAAPDDTFRCKLGMKSVMTVFRNLATIDKTVEKCRVSLHSAEDRLVFQMYCRHGIIKTHKLAFIECETLQAVSPKDMCPNKITSLPKLLCDAVLNFQANQEEITLVVRPDYMALQNYVDDDQDPSKIMRTEMTLSPGEFDQYQVGVDADVTFCLKEFRAILAFADLTNLPLTLQFESGGRPITFSITGDLSYEATFVLATLADVDGSQAPPASQGQGQRATKSSKNTQAHCNTTKARKDNHNSSKQWNGTRQESSNRHRTEENDEDLEMSTSTLNVEQDVSIVNPASCTNYPSSSTSTSCRYETQHTKSNYSALKNVNHNLNKYGRSSLANNSTSNQGRGDEGYDSQSRVSCKDNTDSRSYNGHSVGANGENEGETMDDGSAYDCPQNQLAGRLSVPDPETLDFGSPVIPIQNAEMPADAQDEDEEAEEDDDEIPATPPRKKFCSVFFGTQSSTQPTQSQTKVAMLAPASDDESDDS